MDQTPAVLGQLQLLDPEPESEEGHRLVSFREWRKHLLQEGGDIGSLASSTARNTSRSRAVEIIDPAASKTDRLISVRFTTPARARSGVAAGVR
jgi:hypothetical protein